MSRSLKSYYSHLETTTAAKVPTARPVLRASAIFPMLHFDDVTSRIIFMGYWMLKRNIPQIMAVVTLRSQEGKVLNRESFTIVEPKAYAVELSDLLLGFGFSLDKPFYGSMEIEFFSTVNLVFPYPAVAINYYGPHFSSVVHTAQRVYNDFEDMQANSRSHVPESGFNVHVGEDFEPFIGLINGPIAVSNALIDLHFYNVDHELMSYELYLGTLEPYQTHVIYPAQLLDLKTFLKGQIGAGKIDFQVNWIFPRLLVGNLHRDPNAVTITHSYYDCSEATEESNYWLPNQPQWFPASLMIPVLIKDQFTNIYFYPIYSPSRFVIDIEIYDASGKCLGTKQDYLEIKSPSLEFTEISFKELCQELDINAEGDLGARVIARTHGDERLPARVKMAIDIGNYKLPEMPCNLCTNLQPFNPPLETKPTSFKWAPILADQPNSALWIMNSSPAKSYDKTAHIELTFFRQSDTKTMRREVTLPPQGFMVIRTDHDEELRAFFEGKVGWCTAITTNPYTTTYYFALNPSGVVGGDHGF